MPNPTGRTERARVPIEPDTGKCDPAAELVGRTRRPPLRRAHSRLEQMHGSHAAPRRTHPVGARQMRAARHPERGGLRRRRQDPKAVRQHRQARSTGR